MFLFHGLNAVLLVIFAFILAEYGILTAGPTTVIANGNTMIPGPFLHIQISNIRNILIKRPNLSYELICIATIDETFDFDENNTRYYFTWYQNEVELEIGDGRRRNEFALYHNGTLRLPVGEKASGVYRCQINANETALLSESITVKYPVLKRIPNVPANVTLLAGKSFTFNCPIISVPKANISWFVGNISLTKYTISNRYLFLTNGSLVIRRVTLNDSNKYKCLAHNQYSNKTHRQFVWTVTVVGVETATSMQLVPYMQNRTQYVPENSHLTLLCNGLIEGRPIEWWFQKTRNSPLIKLLNNSYEYQINFANVDSHEGFYTCQLQGTTEKQTFDVIVTMPPTIESELPSYEIYMASTMTLSCRCSGNPKPQLSWYHNGVRLNSSYTRYISGNELAIHSFDPDEAGIYQCFARNIAGEASTAAEMRFKSRTEEKPRENPLKNIRCFAHSFDTINITFDTQVNEPLFIVHIVQSHPHRWFSPFAPMQLNHTSFVVISNHLPFYRPFQIITRTLFPTSKIHDGKNSNQQTIILSSLRSPPVTCCTQGLLLHFLHLENDTYITWSQMELEGIKYYILQFAIHHTSPHPQQLLLEQLYGTVQNVELLAETIKSKLVPIQPLNQSATQTILQNAESKYSDNEARVSHYSQDGEQEEEQANIFNLVVYANVTGVLLKNFTRIKIRVLIITKENEHLAQDFRYVQWKNIENNTSELANSPVRLTTIESRMLTFQFRDGFHESCIKACHWLIEYPVIKVKQEQKCEQLTVVNSQLIMRNLKPTERYRLNFYSCESQILYGHLDVQTLPDPPGAISNHSVIRHKGLKLLWNPPKQKNGKIDHYNILWTLDNVTHETNVYDCEKCVFQFPNINESAKINVTVRVVGDTGIGAPIYIDLRHINHHTLDKELSSNDTEIVHGIAIGTALSVCCIICFALLIVCQRRRFKSRQEIPTHLTTPSELNFSSLNNPSLPSGSAGGLSGGSTIQQDFYEMQTLIPKSRRQIDFQMTPNPDEFRVTHVLNGNDIVVKSAANAPTPTTEPINNTVQKKFANKPFFISIKQLQATISNTPATTTTKTTTTAATAATTTTNELVANTLKSSNHHPLSAASIMPRRTSSASVMQQNGGQKSDDKQQGLSKNSSSCSISSSCSSHKRAFSTNFPKHSNSYDGICLLVEEESVSTPTTETSELTLENKYQILKEPPNKTIVSVNKPNSRTTKAVTKTSLATNMGNDVATGNGKSRRKARNLYLKGLNETNRRPVLDSNG